MTVFLVVSGTDTGVGKTVVTAGLARALVRKGASVVAVKPVESGCDVSIQPSEDGVVLANATGQARPRAALVRLRAPLTPALAAERERVPIDAGALVAEIRALGADADVVLVEGAGGLLAPITWDTNAAALADALGAGVLLVASDRLGCIHHALAALRLVDSARAAGLVLSAPESGDASPGTNAASIRAACSATGVYMPRIVELPRVADATGASTHLAELARTIIERRTS